MDRRLTAGTVSVVLPSGLTRLFPGAETEVEVEAGTVGEMLDALEARWPGMRHRLADERPAIRRHINVLVGGHRATLDTPLAPGTQVCVFTAMSGG